VTLLRTVECGTCGAKHDLLDGGAYLSCAHCGALVGLRDDFVTGEGRADMIRDAIRAQIQPTEAEARQAELTAAMTAAQEHGDRRTWRAAMREYFLLLPVTKPAMLPPDVRSGIELARFAERSAVAAEIATFDPRIQAAMQRMDPKPIYAGDDPVAGAREYVRRATAYLEAIRDHPDYPQGFAAQMNPRAMAKDNLRAMLAGLASLMRREAVEAIWVEVLGATRVEGAMACPHCGAPLAPGVTRCDWCLSELSGGAGQDAWLSSMVSNFAAVKRTVKDPDQLAMVAVSQPLSAHHLGGALPSAEDCRRFLEAAVGHLPQRALVKAIAALKPAYPSEPLASLERSVRASWEQAEAPEEAAPEVASYASVEAASASPWVRQQLALWPQARPDDAASLAVTLISMALSPFHLGGAVSVEEMAAFVRAAEPGLSADALRSAIDQLTPAFASNRAIAAALSSLRQLI